LEELKSLSKISETIVVSFLNLSDDLYKKMSLEWGGVTRQENDVYFATSDVKKDLAVIVLKCSQVGLSISHIDIKKVNLETIFLSLTGKQLRD